MLVYKSSIPRGGALYGDSLLYFYKDKVDCAEVTEFSATSDYSICEVQIGPAGAVGVSGQPNFGLADIGGLFAVGMENEPPLKVVIKIGPAAARGVQGDVNFGASGIGPLDANEGVKRIEFNVGNITLPPVWGYGYEGIIDETIGEITIGPVDAAGASGNVAFGFIGLGTVVANGSSSFSNYLFTTWPGWTTELTLASYTGVAELNLTWPARELTASGQSNDASIALTWPARELVAYSGGDVNLSWPARLLTIKGILESVGSALLTWTDRVLSAEGLSSEIGSIELIWPKRVLSAYAGGVVNLSWPVRVLSLTGELEVVGSIALIKPSWVLTASGILGAVGTIELTWPRRVLLTNGLMGGVGIAELTWPDWILGDTETKITYAVNLSTGAVTKLLLKLFDKLVTAHGKLYGLRDGALTYLGGVSDDGVNIPVTIRFASQQFGTFQAKNLEGAIYLNCRESDGIKLTVIWDETSAWIYASETDTAPAMGTHRVKVGRGIVFHSLGLVVENQDGGKLDIGGIEVPVHPLLRRPR